MPSAAPLRFSSCRCGCRVGPECPARARYDTQLTWSRAVGRGNAEENHRKAEQHGFEFPVLLQDRKWKVSKEYGILATPAAFLIGEDGVIARDAAFGRDALLALVRDRLGGQREE